MTKSAQEVPERRKGLPWLVLSFLSRSATETMVIEGFSKQIVSWILAVSTLLLHHQTAYGLDVEVTDYWCDKSLYVSADFSVRCNGSHRCTFGEDQATITGFGT